MHMEVEQAAAAVLLAVLNLRADTGTRARAVSVAKATVGRAARFVGQNAVQLHGGMGMTEELADAIQDLTTRRETLVTLIEFALHGGDGDEALQ